MEKYQIKIQMSRAWLLKYCSYWKKRKPNVGKSQFLCARFSEGFIVSTTATCMSQKNSFYTLFRFFYWYKYGLIELHAYFLNSFILNKFTDTWIDNALGLSYFLSKLVCYKCTKQVTVYQFQINTVIKTVTVFGCLCYCLYGKIFLLNM